MESGEEEEALVEIKVTLKGSQLRKFERIQDHLGIGSRADVLRHLVNMYSVPPPRFEHINTYEDHATIKDNVLNKTLNVYFKWGEKLGEDGKAFCDLCNLEECHHIDYALSLPEVVKVLKAKGWKR